MRVIMSFNPLINVNKNEYYNLQGTPHPSYREPCEMELGSKIVCSKAVLINGDAHPWTLKGSRVFHKLTLCAYEPGTLRVEGNIRNSFIADNFNHFKTNTIPQFDEFGKSFYANQIHSGVPKPIEEVSEKAEALLNVVCKVEGLANGSFQFMLNQFISKKGECENITVEVVK